MLKQINHQLYNSFSQIVENKATAVVIASTDVALATDLSNIMSSVTFRVFTTKDVIGVEVPSREGPFLAISNN